MSSAFLILIYKEYLNCSVRITTPPSSCRDKKILDWSFSAPNCTASSKMEVLETHIPDSQLILIFHHWCKIQVNSFTIKDVCIVSGTNNARLAQMLRNLAVYYSKDASNLFLVRLAQGLVHLGKVYSLSILILLNTTSFVS